MKNYHKSTILQVLPSLIAGGVERGTVDISQALTENNFNSIVSSRGGPLSKLITAHHARHIELPVDSKNPFQMCSNIYSLAKIIREYKVDIIHARSRAPAWSSYFASRMTKARFITTFHGTYNFSNNLKKYYNSIMTRGERVIAVSDFIRKHIIENYQVNEDRIRLIHRGVDTNNFDPAKTSGTAVAAIKSKYNIIDGVPVLLLPGRFSQWKGQMFLLEALNEIKEQEFYCLIVGDQSRHPEFVKKLYAKITECGLNGKVIISGPEYDMKSLYAAADIIISASIEPEAFGRIAIEAQAMEKLIIATRCGGSCETVVDEVTGFHVKPNDISDFAEKIKFALSILGSQKHLSIVQAARRSVIEHFSLENMKQKTLEVYKELI
ncbi:MAG: capsule biosynthesis protein CapM [Rickettsiaceae bacterium]|jgi:glycosyltransferase involved in cell wall biosynthesis|nr:capsule biosynthesis protein CapM [Rickettsiaceae bacterium]